MTRRIVVAGVALIAAAGAIWWWTHRVPKVWRPALMAREIATRVLAEHLATRYPGGKALVIGNPFSRRAGQPLEVYAFENAGIRGLELGFGSSSSLRVVYPELRREFLENPESVLVDPETTTPLSYLLEEDAFDRLSAANPDCELLVSLIGLPVQVGQSKVWQQPELRLALLLPDWRILGGLDVIRQAIGSGKLAAAVVNRPGAPAMDAAIREADYRAEFARRFLLVTEENYEELLRAHSQLF